MMEDSKADNQIELQTSDHENGKMCIEENP